MPWVSEASRSSNLMREPGRTRSSLENCFIPGSFYTEEMLVLASQSPRRSEILRLAGIPFTVRVADGDESVLAGGDSPDYGQRLAAAKARAAAAAPAGTRVGGGTPRGVA